MWWTLWRNRPATRVHAPGGLRRLLRKDHPGVRLSEHLDGADGATIFEHACRMGLEGIVAKRRDRPYRSRCADWVKVRNPHAPAATRIMEWE
jgi:bifunctional non-homologous end joining protein LigD